MDTSSRVLKRVFIVFILLLIISNIPIYFIQNAREGQSSIQRNIGEYTALDWNEYITQDIYIDDNAIYILVESATGALLFKYDHNMNEVWSSEISFPQNQFTDTYRILKVNTDEIMIAWNNITEYLINTPYRTLNLAWIDQRDGESYITNNTLPPSNYTILSRFDRIISLRDYDIILIPQVLLSGTLQGTVNVFLDLHIIHYFPDLVSFVTFDYRYLITEITDQDWFYYLGNTELVNEQLFFSFTQRAGNDQNFVHTYSLQLPDPIDPSSFGVSRLLYEKTKTYSGKELAISNNGNVVGWNINNENGSRMEVYYQKYQQTWQDPTALYLDERASALDGDNFVFLGNRGKIRNDQTAINEQLVMFLGTVVTNNFQLNQIPLENIIDGSGLVRQFTLSGDLIIFEIQYSRLGPDEKELIVMRMPVVDFLATLLDYSPWNVLTALVGGLATFFILQRRNNEVESTDLYPNSSK